MSLTMAREKKTDTKMYPFRILKGIKIDRTHPELPEVGAEVTCGVGQSG